MKTQPATGETYPKSDLFNKANITINLDDHIQSVQGKGRYEDEMFIIKYFKKGGSAHITFKRLELIDRINDIIARHFPSVLSA
ncbi:DUF4942 domain-containing protein [Escherichia coli]|nr:DUF4942 domain-containing protein [Escherichia coli]